MKKIIAFLAALLLCYSCNNKTEDEDYSNYQIITVHSEKTDECLVSNILYDSNIVLEENKVIEYVKSRIPMKSVDISDQYWIYNAYYKGDEVISRKWYILYFEMFNGKPSHPLSKWKYELISE